MAQAWEKETPSTGIRREKSIARTPVLEARADYRFAGKDRERPSKTPMTTPKLFLDASLTGGRAAGRQFHGFFGRLLFGRIGDIPSSSVRQSVASKGGASHRVEVCGSPPTQVFEFAHFSGWLQEQSLNLLIWLVREGLSLQIPA